MIPWTKFSTSSAATNNSLAVVEDDGFGWGGGGASRDTETSGSTENKRLKIHQNRYPDDVFILKPRF